MTTHPIHLGRPHEYGVSLDKRYRHIAHALLVIVSVTKDVLGLWLSLPWSIRTRSAVPCIGMRYFGRYLLIECVSWNSSKRWPTISQILNIMKIQLEVKPEARVYLRPYFSGTQSISSMLSFAARWSRNSAILTKALLRGNHYTILFHHLILPFDTILLPFVIQPTIWATRESYDSSDWRWPINNGNMLPVHSSSITLLNGGD